MDILGGLREAIDSFYYNIILSLAGLHWSLLRGFVMMGYTIRLINDWLIENAFSPLIEQTNASLSVAISFAFAIALLVLGLTYLLAAFIRLEVVNFRSALTWYVAGALFFALGPSLYRGMNDFRTNIAQGFYLSTLNGLQGTMGSTFTSLEQVETTDLALGPLCDYLDVYLPGATSAGAIDGLDVALAYLRADGPDVMGYPQPMYSPGCPAHLLHPFTGNYISSTPQEWYFDGSYFDVNTSSYYFGEMDDEERADSLAMASSSHARMLTAWPLVLFGVVEQLVYLLITIAMGITFLSFGMAILFAFFKKTEVIARSIIDQWIELIVQTVVIAMVQSLVVTFFLAGTAAGNGMVTLGIGLICLIFMLIVLWSGIKSVWNALNRLFNAMGQVTGGTMLSPGMATVGTAAAGALVTGGALALGSNAMAGMSALNRGATVSQAAGVSLGGFSSLSGAARTLAYLPSARNTPLGEAAEQFTEGSVTRQVARNLPVVGRAAGPMLGARLLSDRDPSSADYDDEGRLLNRPMLVPAVAEGLDYWTLPRGARKRKPSPESAFFEDTDGEMLPADGLPRRMGLFTPIKPASSNEEDELQAQRQQERAAYADEMQGEEMEQHLTDVMRSHTGQSSTLGALLNDQKNGETGETNALGQVVSRLEAAAETMLQAARMQKMIGQLKVSGSGDVAGVMNDVITDFHKDGAQGDADYFTVADRMAQAMGMQPAGDNQPAIQADLTRFGMFVNQALQGGLSGEQAEQVVREVKSSPDTSMSDGLRTVLTEQVMAHGNRNREDAGREVERLEHSARMLPQEITAFGAMQVAVSPQIDIELGDLNVQQAIITDTNATQKGGAS
ncbi:MAG: hypothetical protein RLP44_26915 [Aggregatilineales bacterium]